MLFAKKVPSEELHVSQYLNQANERLSSFVEGTIVRVKPSTDSPPKDWMWALAQSVGKARITLQLSGDEMVTVRGELVVKQRSTAEDFAMDVLADKKGICACPFAACCPFGFIALFNRVVRSKTA